MVSCREIVTLSSLHKSELVAGKNGLDRLVRWVHFIDLPDVIPWVQGGELLIITGIGLEGDITRLTGLVQGLIKKKLAGLIINLGPYIQEIPSQVIELADKAGFPIFSLPWEVKLVEVTQEICSYIVLKQTEKRSVSDFFEQLLLQPVEDADRLIQRAAVYGYALNKPQQVAVLNPSRLLQHVDQEELHDEHKLVSLKTQIEQYVRDSLTIRGKKILSMLWMGAIVLLLPADKKPDNSRHNVALVTELVECLNKKFDGLGFVASLGGRAETLYEVQQSYAQANKVLWLAESNATTKSVYAYEQVGIYKLLFEIPAEKLREYYLDVIEPLNKYDSKYKMELTASLFAFFEENGNVVKTAKRLFVHRNTLDYRLKKIEEVTGRSLNNPYDRLTLQLGVIVGTQLQQRIHLEPLA